MHLCGLFSTDVFTLSHPAVNTLKRTQVIPHFRPSCQKQKHQLSLEHVHEISDLQFSYVIFVLVLQWLLSALFIYFVTAQLGSEIKDTSLILVKLYIFICARVRHKMCTLSNYTLFNGTRLMSLISDPSCCCYSENSFCLACDPRQEKHQSRMPVDLKKAEFAPAGVQARSPSHTFHPEVTGAGGKFQSKNYTAETQTLTLTYLFIHSIPYELFNYITNAYQSIDLTIFIYIYIYISSGVLTAQFLLTNSLLTSVLISHCTW